MDLQETNKQTSESVSRLVIEWSRTGQRLPVKRGRFWVSIGLALLSIAATVFFGIASV